ncbi:autotransporter outer membrane beta-barrel domain-containing protein [Salmonella enterica]|nr:autotransporter outer membrane beta-barrel domain-containing protein [Salmonella enterica]EDX0904534.1 autotransporter outer membrane beta-barrel domain-containing protein [Salmonella enterica subsp. enterica]EFS2847484.1 autotransporter outer membrane beta-barrel domain-containing protein [Salmonella enterica]EKZ2353181.1 autotransporter outer membrane beta-barrel domain-containing protein [Salmonella enterica]ELJ5530371.1 autotransporter outer membrane beta-barrel domain-containing protein
MVDVDNTLLAIGNTASQLSSVINMRQSALLNLLDEDCTTGQGPFCVGLGSRFADSDKFNFTSGWLTLGYYPSERVRFGVTLDQTLSQSLPSDYDLKSNKPGVGMFTILKPSNELEVRFGVAWKEDDIEISRQQLSNTEAGKGKTTLTAYAAKVNVSYKSYDDGKLIIQPFGGVMHSNVRRKGYSEYNDISFEAKYNSVESKATTLRSGVQAQYQLGNQVTVDAKSTVEHDISSSYNDFIVDINTIGRFAQSTPDLRKTRLASDINVRFNPDKDSEYYAGFYWKQSSLNRENEAGLRIGYEVSF